MMKHLPGSCLCRTWQAASNVGCAGPGKVYSRADVTAEDEVRPKQVNQSLLTVLIAFLANLLIAICEVPSLPRLPRRRRCWLRAAILGGVVYRAAQSGHRFRPHVGQRRDA